MPNIKLTAQNFSGTFAALNSTTNVSLSHVQFLLASLTLGFQRLGGFYKSGFRSMFHRFGIGMSSLAYFEDHRGNWKLADDYNKLDASEKSAMSYWQGMVFAKLIAERHLNVPWLAHVDDMRAKGLLTTTAPTKERGDLVGRDRSGAWHVIEAKGRSSCLETGLLTKAKLQASLVATINGVSPQTNSACISKLWKTPIEVLLDDPPQDENSQESWDFKENTFWEYYYGNMAGYIKKSDLAEKNNFLKSYRVAPLLYGDLPFPGFPRFSKWLWRDWPHLWIGLPIDIIDSPAKASSYKYETPKGNVNEEGIFIASDHSALIIGEIERL